MPRVGKFFPPSEPQPPVERRIDDGADNGKTKPKAFAVSLGLESSTGSILLDTVLHLSFVARVLCRT